MLNEMFLNFNLTFNLNISPLISIFLLNVSPLIIGYYCTIEMDHECLLIIIYHIAGNFLSTYIYSVLELLIRNFVDNLE